MVIKNNSLLILGQNVPLVHYPVDWSVEPEQSFEFKTGIFHPPLGREQRSTSLQEGEFSTTLRVSYLIDGKRESRKVYNRILGLKGKPAVIPWFTEQMLDDTDRFGVNHFYCKNVSLEHIKVLTTQVVRMDRDDPSIVENQVVTGTNFDTGLVSVEHLWRLNIPAERQLFYFCRGATVTSLSRAHITDQTSRIDVLWGSHDDGFLP